MAGKLITRLFLLGCALWAQPLERADYAQALTEAGKLFDQEDFAGVVAKLRPWVERYPNETKGRHGLGLAYYQQHDFAQAIHHLSVAVQQETKDSPAWRQTTEILGMAYYLSRNWEDAAPLLEQAATWSHDSNLLYALAMTHVNRHSRERARQAFARVFDISPDDPSAYMLTADLMYQEMFGDDAEALYQQVRSKWRDFPEVRYKLGLIAATRRDYAAVIEHMQGELRVNPGHSLAWHYLGEALAKLQKPDDATAALQRAIWLNARSVRSYVALAQVYSEQGRFGIAESSLKHALEIDPQNYEANFLLGKLYLKTNRPELAREQMSIAEKLRKPPEK